MNPSADLRRQVQEHFQGLCFRFYELSKGWDQARFFRESVFANVCVGIALARRTIEHWWEMPNGIAKIRRINRDVTEILMKHGEPAPHRIDPDVWRFVWVEEEPRRYY